MNATLDIPTLRTAPADLARLIDAIEPHARLLYAGGGCWRLWRLARDPQELARRYRMGAGMLDKMLTLDGYRMGAGRNAGKVTQAMMFLRGYAWEFDYHVGAGEPNSSIADDFQIRLWGEHNMTPRDLERLIELAAGDDALNAREAKIRDYAESNARSIHRWAFKRPVSIINPLGGKVA
jgi:hypothetical protein